MAVENRGAVVSNASTGNVNVSFLPTPIASSYVVVVVGLSATSVSVSSVVCGTGTFVLAGAANSANRRVEIWVGYNFATSYPTTVVVGRSAGTANMAVTARCFDVFANVATAPSFTVSTPNTGTGTSADCGSLTPAVGDLLVAAVVMDSITADSTARTHTGNAYWGNAGTELTNVREESGWTQAVAASASKEVWTLGVSAEYVALQVLWTPPAPPSATAGVLLKGLTTAADDIASTY